MLGNKVVAKFKILLALFASKKININFLLTLTYSETKALLYDQWFKITTAIIGILLSSIAYTVLTAQWEGK